MNRVLILLTYLFGETVVTLVFWGLMNAVDWTKKPGPGSGNQSPSRSPKQSNAS